MKPGHPGNEPVTPSAHVELGFVEHGQREQRSRFPKPYLNRAHLSTSVWPKTLSRNGRERSDRQLYVRTHGASRHFAD